MDVTRRLTGIRKRPDNRFNKLQVKFKQNYIFNQTSDLGPIFDAMPDNWRKRILLHCSYVRTRS